MTRRAVALTAVVAMAGAAMPLLPRVASASTQLCSTPQIQSLSPQHGKAGTTVTITGSGFSPGICSLSVSVGGNTVSSPHVVDSGHITFSAQDAWYGGVQVSLTDSSNASNPSNNNLTYVTDPGFNLNLDNGTPATGATVHILGTGFQFGSLQGAEQTTATYTWTAPGTSGNCAGAPSAAPAIQDSGHIAVQVPSQYCDGAVNLTLSAPSDTANPSSNRITYTFSGHFDIAANPTGMSRTSAVPGQTVTVSGTGLGNQGGTATINGQGAPVQSWSDTAVTVQVPSTATSGALTFVRAVDSKSFSAPQSLTVSGSVSSVTPSQGAVGDSITVSGAGFGTQAGSVSIGGTAATVSSWSPSSIAFTVPDGVTAGGTTISITTNGTAAPSAPAFTVLAKVTGMTPAHAPAGSVVEIDGTTFGTQQGMVQVGGQDATVTVWGDKSVVVQLPSGLAAGPTTVSLTPVGSSAAASYPYSIDAPPPPSSTGGGGSGSGSGSSGGGSGSGSGSTSGGSGGGHTSPVPGTPGVQVASNGLILPSASGPVIAHGPVQFTKPSPPPGPVSLKLDAKDAQSDPGTAVPFTVSLIAFGKPVVGAPVDLLLVIEPGSDAALDPVHGVTNAQGQVTGTIHLSKTPGDHIVLARSGIYSDEVRVVGRGANATVASGRVGTADTGSAMPSLVSVRSPVLWALVACILLFGAGFGLNLVTAPAYGGGAGAATTARQRSAREALLDIAAAAGSVARYGASLVAVLGALALGAVRGRD